MTPGNLVELWDDADGEGITVGGMPNDPIQRREFPAGTLAVWLGRHHLLKRSTRASVILIGGKPGWVWDSEIRPVNGATAPA